MNFVSFNFLVFLLAVIILYYALPKKVQWIVLLSANYVFYLLSGIEQAAFIIFTTLLTFFAALLMQKYWDEHAAFMAENKESMSREEKKAAKAAVNKKVHRIQVITVLISLIILASCKYLGFAVENLNSLFAVFRWDISIPLTNIIVPLGISFYTFQSLSYVLDIGRNKYPAERHLGYYAVFVSFFPTVVQGPICNFQEVGMQFKKEHRIDYDNLKFGAQLMMWGFFTKLVIADRVVDVVNTIFAKDGYSAYSGSILFFGMLAYAVQIYCDFSGGINIAIGAAKMLGIELPKNFERPYFSVSVSDYWRRWHITLGAWMREYVFYPVMLSKFVSKLSNSARKKIGTYAGRVVPSAITPFVVFILIGVWHGASWQFLVFGLYNAVVVAGGVILTPVFQWFTKILRINTEAFSWRIFCIIRTFLLTGISKILVIAPGLSAAIFIIKKMFTDFSIDSLGENLFNLGLDEKNFAVAIAAVLVLFVVSVLQESGMKLRETIARQNLAFRWILPLGLLAVILVFGCYGPEYDAASFIYEAY